MNPPNQDIVPNLVYYFDFIILKYFDSIPSKQNKFPFLKTLFPGLINTQCQ